MSEKKSDHQVNIVRLGEPRIHPNADTLELFDVQGYQCVSKKGTLKAGDLAVYLQPDSVVPQTEAFRFIWGPYREVGTNDLVPERRRRITCKRLRKEYSEGLLMPMSDFFDARVDEPCIGFTGYSPKGSRELLSEGQDVSDILGITHYTGDQEVEDTDSDSVGSKPKLRRPKTFRGWFYFILYKLGFRGARRNMNEELTFDVPKFDVENFKNHKNVLIPGEPVIVTEKLHGSQARYVYKDGQMHVGSRNFWKAPNSSCVWRKALAQNKWIEEFCRANEGYVLYGEVVPTQKGYLYGQEPGKVGFYVFDVRHASGDYLPKRVTLEYPELFDKVPVLYDGPYDAEVIAKLVDGVSAVDGRTQREGVVITVLDPNRWARGIGRIQLKWKSSSFLEKEGNR
jgi:hypothetical protein